MPSPFHRSVPMGRWDLLRSSLALAPWARGVIWRWWVSMVVPALGPMWRAGPDRSPRTPRGAPWRTGAAASAETNFPPATGFLTRLHSFCHTAEHHRPMQPRARSSSPQPPAPNVQLWGMEHLWESSTFGNRTPVGISRSRVDWRLCFLNRLPF